MSTDACVLATGPTTSQGYVRLGTGAGRQAYAHRLAYEATHGPIPDGLTVDHLCFNPPCVNPAHLRLLTRSENARNQRGATKTHCIRGHEFTAANTYRQPSRPTTRLCRACREMHTERRTRRAAAARSRANRAAMASRGAA